MTAMGKTRFSRQEQRTSVSVKGCRTPARARRDASVGTDTFTGVNSLSGSAFGDTFSGSANSDNFVGLGGNDVIDGRAGFDTAIYQGFNMPGRYEGEILDLDVEGDIPTDLDGAFFRVAPDPAFPPLHGTDIYFNGEAVMIYHEPMAHTDGDSIVFFRKSDVVVAGDTFVTTSYPFMVLFNVVVFAVSGGLGLTFLLQTLHRLSVAGSRPPSSPWRRASSFG